MPKPLRCFRFVALAFALGLGLVPGCQSANSPQAEEPTYFGISEQDGVWAFVDPQSRPFFSIGINVIEPTDKADVQGPKYDGLAEHNGNVEKWRAQTLERLDAWNVNTIGAWSSLRGKPYVLALSLSYSWIDVFDDSFETYVCKAATDVLSRHDVAADYATLDADPLLIGYFTDNELVWGWGYGWSGEKNNYSLFEYYASLGPETAGKKAWTAYVAETYGDDWARLSEVWNADIRSADDLRRVKAIAPRSPKHFAEAQRVGDRFLRRVAERYFEVTSRVMRGRLGHHLNLGIRMTPGVPDVVAETSGRYVDVVSFNMYTSDLDHFRREVTRLHDASQKPILVTEFAFTARENRSGNKNRGYEQAEVPDDAQRGAHYARWAQMLSELPFVVGFHWFQFFDEPTHGRADGESVNFGFVDLKNRVYADLTQVAGEANAAALRRRQALSSDGPRDRSGKPAASSSQRHRTMPRRKRSKARRVGVARASGRRRPNWKSCPNWASISQPGKSTGCCTRDTTHCTTPESLSQAAHAAEEGTAEARLRSAVPAAHGLAGNERGP